MLSTLILYPAAPRECAASPRGSRPTGGRFPLVVFAPGFDRNPSSYRPLLTAWARSGFVVAAITFPLTNPRAIGGLDEADIENQPADVRFVITQVLRASRSGSGVLRRLVDPARIAVAGHSDGAQTAVLVADGACCRDRRIRASIVMAGAELPPGHYFAPPGRPTIVMQGTADSINPPSRAIHIYAMARPPKYLLLLKGADHLLPFTGTNRYEAVVRDISIAFLDRYLAGGSRPVSVPARRRNLASLKHVGG